MKCYKCKMEINGNPNQLMINKWGDLDYKYGSIKPVCNNCKEELL